MYSSIFWLIITHTCIVTAVFADYWRLPNGDAMRCWPQTRRSPPKITNVADCDAAINMIPSGQFVISHLRYGHPTKPISLFLSQNGGRGLRLPAAFIAGSCAITVRSIGLATPHPPEQAATAMFFRVWPKVRAAAKVLTRKCWSPETPNSQRIYANGMLTTKTFLNGWQFTYEVQVRGAPDTLPEPTTIETYYRLENYYKYFNSKVRWMDKIRTKRLREEYANLAPSEGFVDAPPRGNKSSRRKPNTRYGKAFLT